MDSITHTWTLKGMSNPCLLDSVLGFGRSLVLPTFGVQTWASIVPKMLAKNLQKRARPSKRSPFTFRLFGFRHGPSAREECRREVTKGGPLHKLNLGHNPNPPLIGLIEPLFRLAPLLYLWNTSGRACTIRLPNTQNYVPRFF